MQITVSDNSFILSFPYDHATVEMVKAMPDGRRYMPADKTWKAPITLDNCQYLIDHGHDTAIVRDALDRINAPRVAPDMDCIDWGAVTPFNHQRIGTSHLLQHDAWALFFEQGCGKTLCAVKMLEKTGIRALIVCPKTVMRSWQNEFAKYSTIVPVLVEGSAAKRGAALRSAHVAIVNYDVLAKHIDDINFDCVIYDESQFLKSGKAQRTKAAGAIAAKASKRYLLTGTPIANNAADIFSQYKILDSQIFGTSFYSFRSKYFENRGRYFPDWQIKAGSIEAIKEKIQMRSYRVLKADVLDLPEKLYQTQYIEMQPEQRRIYKQLEKELIAEIGDVTISINYLLPKLMKLNQVASGFIIDTNGGGQTVEIEHDKLHTLRQIIDDYSGAVVVFCLFRHDIDAILSIYPDAVHIDGAVSADQRQIAIDMIETGVKRLIVLQEQAGSVGITLVKPHLCIFYSHSYSLLNRLQAEDRLHRIGQKNPVLILDLITENTIECDIMEAINCKRNLAADVQGDSLAGDIILRLKKC